MLLSLTDQSIIVVRRPLSAFNGSNVAPFWVICRQVLYINTSVLSFADVGLLFEIKTVIKVEL